MMVPKFDVSEHFACTCTKLSYTINTIETICIFIVGTNIAFVSYFVMKFKFHQAV